MTHLRIMYVVKSWASFSAKNRRKYKFNDIPLNQRDISLTECLISYTRSLDCRQSCTYDDFVKRCRGYLTRKEESE